MLSLARNVKVEITFIILKITTSPTAPASKGLACNKSAYLERQTPSKEQKKKNILNFNLNRHEYKKIQIFNVMIRDKQYDTFKKM